jgi:predicted membrane channel-forming protein YqfA (hemolysin III family)
MALSIRQRKAIGATAIIVGLALYCMVAVALVGDYAHEWPLLLETLLYLVLGVAWVLPLRPVMIWMETGRWRVERRNG